MSADSSLSQGYPITLHPAEASPPCQNGIDNCNQHQGGMRSSGAISQTLLARRLSSAGLHALLDGTNWA